MSSNMHRSRFFFGSILTSCLLLTGLVMSLAAQGDSASAGGSWRAYASEDAMTAAKRVRFELLSDSSLRANRDLPDTKIDLFCENGKFKGGYFSPGPRLGRPNHPGFWGQPQMEVRVRVDNSHSDHGWNWEGNRLSMDKDTARELIGAQIFKIQYLGRRAPVIAEFSPAGLDLTRLSQACHGLTPKKP